jgi:predicted nucleic acid-binding protein
MISYIVDASVAVKWYVPEIHSIAAEKLLSGSNDLHAPDLILPEFGNIIWKKIRRTEITSGKGRKIIEAFLRVPLQRHSSELLLEPAFEIANNLGQTVYDSTYLVLAVALNSTMVTADEKFYEAISQSPLGGHILWVEDLP